MRVLGKTWTRAKSSGSAFDSAISWFALASMLLLTAGCQQAEVRVGWHPIEPAAEISQRLAEELASEFAVTTRAFKDSTELMDALQAREIDLAILEEPARPLTDLQVLRAMYPSVLHVLARPSVLDADFSNVLIADVIKNQSVYAGPPGGAGHALIELLVEQGIFPPLTEFSLMESIFDGDPDVSIIFGGILTQDDQRVFSQHRLVSLGSVQDYGRGSWAEGVSMRAPSVQPFIIPEGLYPGIAMEPVLSLSVRSLLVTHPDLEDDVAYAVLQKVDQMMAQFRSIYSLAGREQQDTNEISYNISTHSGALRYQQREAPGFLERYAEILAFLVTALLALSSMIVALFRMRKRARKDRIDVYFQQLLELREHLNQEPESAPELERKVVSLQHTVTNLVSEERISADTAFVGFLELSNQILQETKSRQ